MIREPSRINENEDKMPFDLTAAIVKEIEYQLNDVCSLLRCETGVTILQLSEYAGYYCIGSKRPSIDLYNSLIDLMQPRLMQLVPSPKEKLVYCSTINNENQLVFHVKGILGEIDSKPQAFKRDPVKVLTEGIIAVIARETQDCYPSNSISIRIKPDSNKSGCYLISLVGADFSELISKLKSKIVELFEIVVQGKEYFYTLPKDSGCQVGIDVAKMVAEILRLPPESEAAPVSSPYQTGPYVPSRSSGSDLSSSSPSSSSSPFGQISSSDIESTVQDRVSQILDMVRKEIKGWHDNDEVAKKVDIVERKSGTERGHYRLDLWAKDATKLSPFIEKLKAKITAEFKITSEVYTFSYGQQFFIGLNVAKMARDLAGAQIGDDAKKYVQSLETGASSSSAANSYQVGVYVSSQSASSASSTSSTSSTSNPYSQVVYVPSQKNPQSPSAELSMKDQIAQIIVEVKGVITSEVPTTQEVKIEKRSGSSNHYRIGLVKKRAEDLLSIVEAIKARCIEKFGIDPELYTYSIADINAYNHYTPNGYLIGFDLENMAKKILEKNKKPVDEIKIDSSSSSSSFSFNNVEILIGQDPFDPTNFVIALSGKALLTTKKQKFHQILVVDRSASMSVDSSIGVCKSAKDSPFGVLKEGIINSLRTLFQKGYLVHVSLILFDDKTQLLFKCLSLTEENLRSIEEKLLAAQTGGQTDIPSALRVAFQLVSDDQKGFNPELGAGFDFQEIILITDGEQSVREKLYEGDLQAVFAIKKIPPTFSIIAFKNKANAKQLNALRNEANKAMSVILDRPFAGFYYISRLALLLETIAEIIMNAASPRVPSGSYIECTVLNEDKRIPFRHILKSQPIENVLNMYICPPVSVINREHQITLEMGFFSNGKPVSIYGFDFGNKHQKMPPKIICAGNKITVEFTSAQIERHDSVSAYFCNAQRLAIDALDTEEEKHPAKLEVLKMQEVKLTELQRTIHKEIHALQLTGDKTPELEKFLSDVDVLLDYTRGQISAYSLTTSGLGLMPPKQNEEKLDVDARRTPYQKQYGTGRTEYSGTTTTIKTVHETTIHTSPLTK